MSRHRAQGGTNLASEFCYFKTISNRTSFSYAFAVVRRRAQNKHDTEEV